MVNADYSDMDLPPLGTRNRPNGYVGCKAPMFSFTRLRIVYMPARSCSCSASPGTSPACTTIESWDGSDSVYGRPRRYSRSWPLSSSV